MVDYWIFLVLARKSSVVMFADGKTKAAEL